MATLRATILAQVKAEQLDKLSKQLDGLSGKMTSFGNMAKKAVGGVASLGAALVSSKFIGDSVEQAKNLERSILALDSVFGATAPRMVEFSKNAVSMGLSQSEAAKASTFLGSVLQQYGFDADSAAVETEKLTKLSADLAATYGYDVQEALLAVTALFRGEYDPIEKFGVAMKQNEINAIRNARGLGDLTGAAEMQADAQIRLELLMQRSTKAQGAMERGAGTLYVETEKLRATFENLQANLGQQLIPVFAELFEKLRPIIEDAAPALVEIFKFVGEVITEIGQVFLDLFNPTTQLGESLMALGNSFESLGQTIFGEDFDIGSIFDVARWALDLFLRALNDLILILQNIIFFGQAVGQVFGALFSGDWDSPALQKGINGITQELIAQRDAALEAANAMDVLYYKAAQSLTPEALGDQTEIWDKIAENAAKAGLETGTQFGDNLIKGAGAATKDAVADFWAGLTEEVEKQAARMRLEAMGASEGLIGAILGASGDWQKVFDSIVSGGMKAIEKAQSLFNKTAAGIKEIEEGAKKAQEQLQKLLDLEISRAREMAGAQEETRVYYETYARLLEGGFEKEVAIQVAREDFANSLLIKNNELIAQQKELADAFAKSSDEIFSAFMGGGATEEVGEYTQAVRQLGSQLKELIEVNPFEGDKGLFTDQNQAQLTSSVDNVITVMEKVSQARDKLVADLAAAQQSLEEQLANKQSLMESIVDGLMGGVNITRVRGDANAIIDSLTDTLIRTNRLMRDIDKLRGMGLNEAIIQQIIASGAEVGSETARALTRGGSIAIEKINSLYSSIQSVSERIGSQTASAMYDSGIQTTQGLVDGLLSQADQLEMAAFKLAEKFKRAFDNAIAGRSVSFTSSSYESILSSLSSGSPYSSYLSSVPMPSYSSSGGSNINVTINAGLGTDPVALGREVTNAISRYESVGGRVFARA